MDGRHSEEAPSREEDIFRSTMRIDLTPELLKKLGVSQEAAGSKQPCAGGPAGERLPVSRAS